MKKMLALTALLVLALPLAALAFPKVGDPIVPFSIDTDAGTKVDSAKITGKGPIVLSFVNTSCSTCNQEMADMKKTLAKNPNVQYYPILVDARSTSLKAFKEGSGYTYTFLLDPNYEYGRKYGATFSPFTVVADKDGKITGILKGYGDAEAAELQKLIK